MGSLWSCFWIRCLELERGCGAEGVRTAMLVSSTNLSIGFGNKTRVRISIQVLESAKMILSHKRRHLSVIGIVTKWLVLFLPSNVNLTKLLNRDAIWNANAHRFVNKDSSMNLGSLEEFCYNSIALLKCRF